MREGAALLGRVALPPEGADELDVLRAPVAHPAGDLRLDRLLHGRLGEPFRDAALRVTRRRVDGNLVGDALRLRRRDPVAALAGDARADGGRTAPVRSRPAAAHGRDLDARDLL